MAEFIELPAGVSNVLLAIFDVSMLLTEVELKLLIPGHYQSFGGGGGLSFHEVNYYFGLLK